MRGFVPYCIPLGFVVCPVQDDGGCDQTNLCIVNATDASSGSICQSTTATTTTSTATTVTLPTATSTIDITSVNGTANFGSPGFDSKGAASVSAEGSRDVNDDIDESFDEVELINLLVSDLSTQDASNRNVVAGVIITVVILAIIIVRSTPPPQYDSSCKRRMCCIIYTHNLFREGGWERESARARAAPRACVRAYVRAWDKGTKSCVLRALSLPDATCTWPHLSLALFSTNYYIIIAMICMV